MTGDGAWLLYSRGKWNPATQSLEVRDEDGKLLAFVTSEWLNFTGRTDLGERKP